MIFHHGRYQIWSKSQHPYAHVLSEFYYSNPALPQGNVYNLQQAMDWIFAVLYPNSKAPVATPAALPTLGNTLNDYRVVNDDGDGKAASYRWEQREGEASPSWHKIYDMDWGEGSILSAFLTKTQDVYVFKHGYDDVDGAGSPLSGLLGGQHIYGGKSAGSHLTLHANAGDGIGFNTGYIQLDDDVRPTVDSTYEMGTNTERFLNLWTDEANIGTMNISDGSITDTTGTIDFGDEDLTTDGNIVVQTMLLTTGSITDTTGNIDFDDENLITTGNIDGAIGTFNHIVATGAASQFASGTTVGDLTLSNGSITDSSGAIDFDDEDLLTTGSITGGDGLFADVFISTGSIGITTVDGDLSLSANGTGKVKVLSAMETIGQTVIGNVDITGVETITGQLNVDQVRIDTGTVSCIATHPLNAYGYLWLTSLGGLVRIRTPAPYTTDGDSLGDSSHRWNNLYMIGSISNSSQSMTVDNLLTLRDINAGVSAGMTIFWDGSKWVASYPDTEVDHGTITGLLDDDHTQYLLLAGRSGGQTVFGGTLASDDLILDSTAHATKGQVVFASDLHPATDNARDIGDATHRVKDMYLAGQAFGMRFENATTLGEPAASALTKGRVYFNTDTDDLMIDIGGAWRKISAEKYEITDAWTGAETSKVYTVSGSVSDARSCIWALYDVSGSYAEVQASITKTQTQVTVTVITPLPAGNYKLVGIG